MHLLVPPWPPLAIPAVAGSVVIPLARVTHPSIGLQLLGGNVSHRIGWILTPLLAAVVAAVPAVAGGYGKCSTANTQECLDMMAKMLKNKGWIGVEINDAAGSMQITRVLPDSP